MITKIPNSLTNDQGRTALIINLLLQQIKVLKQNIPKNKKLKISDLERQTLAYLYHQLENPGDLLFIFKPETLKIWYNLFFLNRNYSYDYPQYYL